MEIILLFIKRIYSFSGKTLIINLLGMAIVSLLDGVGIFLLIPMINNSGILSLNHSGGSSISKIFSLQQFLPNQYKIPFLLGIFLLIVIAQSVFQRILMIKNVKIQQSFFRSLRLESYRALLEANWIFYIKKRKSDLINVLTLELARINSGINTILQLLTSIIFTLIQIMIAFYLSIKMTAFILIGGIILMFISRKFISRAKSLGNYTSELGQSYLAGITDDFNGIKDIKSNTLESLRLERFHDITKGIFQEQMEYIRLKSSSDQFYKVTSAILIAVFIFLSINLFHTQAEQLLLIILIFSRLWPRLTTIQGSIQQLATALPAFKIFLDLQEECLESKEWSLKVGEFNLLAPIAFNNCIECKNVNFKYNKKELKLTLKDINLKIMANQMTAIVGRSGAGKSTLIELLLGLLLPETGKILLDGKRLSKEDFLSLRQSISYVPQEPFLFNGSIRENMKIVQPNVTDELIWESLKFASADFVKELPNGLDTKIGDRGVKLSGGERQRIVLARAILRNPSILILDEATSALDTENESKIQMALEELKGKMTIIVIAHRLSTIRNADQVIVLEQGEIIQQGQFSQLVSENKGMFNHLLKKQMEMSI